jgi:hypothetical protein
MERDNLEDLGVNRTLEWILKIGGGCRLYSPSSGQGPVAGSCENGSKPSGYINGEKFLD